MTEGERAMTDAYLRLEDAIIALAPLILTRDAARAFADVAKAAVQLRRLVPVEQSETQP